jgi:uncharacterized membrane protein YfcA
MQWTAGQMLAIALIGLVGGTLGGLLGLGGSVFIIPALTLLLGTNQHLYQASALIANIFVAGAATLRHRGRGTIRRDIAPVMAASTTLAAIAGVVVSNMLQPKPLAAVFGVFLLYAAASEVRGLVRRAPDPEAPASEGTRWKLGIWVGAIGGFVSGLLGIGGGAIMVPLLRRFGKLPVRQAVASSAAAMIVACTVGATAKNLSITGLTDASGQPLTHQSALFLALLLTPMATLGGSLGAALVYKLPIVAIRACLSLLLAFAGFRMVTVGGAELLETIQSWIGAR